MPVVIGPNGKDLARLVSILESGGVMAFPADTVWGLGASAARPDAIVRIKAIKNRSDKHPFPVYAASAAQVWRVLKDVPPAARVLADRFWPGALTMVLRIKEDTPYTHLCGGDGTVGFRVPSPAFLRDAAKMLDTFIVNTSANRTGQPPLPTMSRVEEHLADRIDAIVSTGHAPAGISSTVIRPSGWTFDLLREGAVTRSQLESCLSDFKRVDSDDSHLAPGATYR